MNEVKEMDKQLKANLSLKHIGSSLFYLIMHVNKCKASALSMADSQMLIYLVRIYNINQYEIPYFYSFLLAAN